ncbi:hypothetical protein [Streptomyces globisporus]|uniref:hypothetical protein n=1 Tax=Streptomyces globisporus TaxID=1908 RepID=UPI0036A9DF44
MTLRAAGAPVRVDAGALHALGLYSGQPTSVVAAPSPPCRWHAAAGRNAERRSEG